MYKHFINHHDQSFVRTTAGVGRAIRTVIFVPDHDSTLYEEVIAQLQKHPQPVQDSALEQARGIEDLLRRKMHQADLPKLSHRELVGLFGVLMQFMSYDSRLLPYANTQFEDVEKLYQAIIMAGHSKPLSCDQQLEIALDLKAGDVLEALWLLFITSRQYARWFDMNAIVGMPGMGRRQAENRMLAWGRSLLAYKSGDAYPVQDVSGDTYYVWTHALACVVYTLLPAHRTLGIRLMSRALRHGTWLNHHVAHKVTAQRVPSDHTIAARYGIGIGDTVTRCLKELVA